jgi:hypothetical protein
MTMDPSLPVKDLLALVDKTFGVERILSDKGRDIIKILCAVWPGL